METYKIASLIIARVRVRVESHDFWKFDNLIGDILYVKLINHLHEGGVAVFGKFILRNTTGVLRSCHNPVCIMLVRLTIMHDLP